MGQLLPLLAAMRPRQWTKNFVVLLPLAFTINLSWDPGDADEVLEVVGYTAAAFGLFCLLSSGGLPGQRPCGRREGPPAPEEGGEGGGVGAGVQVGGGNCGGGVRRGGGARRVSPRNKLRLGAGCVRRHIGDLHNRSPAGGDTGCVRHIGGVHRAGGGGALVISAEPSPWLYICTGLGALFIGFAKRRQELLTLEDEGAGHRASLGVYSVAMLDQLITMLMAATLIAYILYTFTADNLPPNDAMMFTIPFVVFGIARYFYLIHAKQAGGSPEEILLRDLPILVSVAGWVAATVGILWAYRG